MFNSALEDWNSLYSVDLDSLWNSNPKELRRVTMLFHTLKQEFSRIEANIENKIDKFSQRKEVIERFSKSNNVKPLQSLSYTTEEPQLTKSPKLNRHRKGSHLKRPATSPSLLDIQVKAKKNIFQVSEEKQSAISENKCISDVKDLSEVFNESIFKTPTEVAQQENVDIVDCSFIVEETPSNIGKKIKWKGKNTKRLDSKIEIKKKKVYTITQMFDSLPNQRTALKKLNCTKNLTHNEASQDTFFIADEKKSIKHNNENVPVDEAFFKDYDKIPIAKSTSPQHVHKTETVRRKVDRLKLPGWSCNDCQEYYEGLNLSPEELRKKMNICSKHRNKFPVLDQTIEGYWDVAMPHDTLESLDNDTTRFS